MNKILRKECLAAIGTFNNGEDLKNLLNRIPNDYPFDLVIHVDGSTDGSEKILKNHPYPVIGEKMNKGIGKAIKNTIKYAFENNYKALAFIPGNNKNDPNEVSRLFNQIIENGADYVQGSRYLPGSKKDHTPIFRLLIVKVHAFFFSVLTGRKCTDALEGFRAYRLSVFNDSQIDIWQDWLDTYEFETYLHYKVLKDKKFNVVEVPVSKIYPQNRKHILNKNGAKYTHIRPFIDWWRILRPILYLKLGLKK
jgi:dolichol-phosphate mannosyltransferase